MCKNTLYKTKGASFTLSRDSFIAEFVLLSFSQQHHHRTGNKYIQNTIILCSPRLMSFLIVVFTLRSNEALRIKLNEILFFLKNLYIV